MTLFNSLLSGDYLTFVIQLVVKTFTIFCVLPVHEWAHAWMSTRLGDQTARLSGRLTLKPTAHLTLWGTLLMLFCGFGYAKPVPVNIRNFKNPKRDFAITALAGPASNLIMAFVYCFLANLAFAHAASSTIIEACYIFFNYAAYINVGLAVFNLLPVPPLDGSRLITVIVPDKYYYKILQYERYIMIGLIVLLFTGVLTVPLEFITNLIMKLFIFITGIPF